jgi:hypothetical protein
MCGVFITSYKSARLRRVEALIKEAFEKQKMDEKDVSSKKQP